MLTKPYIDYELSSILHETRNFTMDLYIHIIYKCRLPGKAYCKKKHVWITGANEIDSKIFSRAILAKVYSLVISTTLFSNPFSNLLEVDYTFITLFPF